MINNLYKLSICMIIKNEEKNLKRCLNSLKIFLDNNYAELIIVDTGSTDKSIEISKLYTDKIYYYEWKNDFSDARNFSISFARGEWIFIFDADEEIEFEQAKLLMRFLNEDETSFFNTITLKVKNFFYDNNKNQFTIFQQPLLFKNNGKFRYSGKVHNQPQFEFPMLNLPVEILHYGYIRNPELIEKKFERTSKLLIDVLKDDPDNVYYRFQLANTYTYYNKTKNAIIEVEKAFETINRLNLNKKEYLYLYTIAVHNYIIEKEFSLAEKYCLEAIGLKPNNIDFYYYASCIYEKTGQLDLLKKYAKKYLELYENWDNINDASDISYIYYSLDKKDIINLFLAKVYESENNAEMVLKYLTEINDKEIIISNMKGILKYIINNNNVEYFINYYINKIKDRKKLIEKFFYEIELLYISYDEKEKNTLNECINKLLSYDNNIFLQLYKYCNLDEIHTFKQNNTCKDIINIAISYSKDNNLPELLKFRVLINTINYEYKFEELLSLFTKNEIITCISQISLNSNIFKLLIEIIVNKQQYVLDCIKKNNTRNDLLEKIIILLKSLILIIWEKYKIIEEKKIIDMYISIGEYLYLNDIKTEDYELFKYLYFLNNGYNHNNEDSENIIKKLINKNLGYNNELLRIFLSKVYDICYKGIEISDIDEQINKNEDVITEISRINIILSKYNYKHYLLDYYLIRKEISEDYIQFIMNLLNNIDKLKNLKIVKELIFKIISTNLNLSNELYGQIIISLIINFSKENEFLLTMNNFIQLFLSNKISEAIAVLRDSLKLKDKNQNIINYFYKNFIFKLIKIDLIQKKYTFISNKFINYLNNTFTLKRFNEINESDFSNIFKQDKYIFLEGLDTNVINYINDFYNNNNITLFISEFDFNYENLRKVDWGKIKNIVFTHDYLKNLFVTNFYEESRNIRIFVYQWDVDENIDKINYSKNKIGIIINLNMVHNFFDRSKIKLKIEFLINMLKFTKELFDNKLILYFYGDNKLYQSYLSELFLNNNDDSFKYEIKYLKSQFFKLRDDVDILLIIENNDGIGIGISKSVNEKINLISANYPHFKTLTNFALSIDSIYDFENIINSRFVENNKLLYDYYYNKDFDDIINIFLE